METYTLSNGVTIPKIGFGTWQIPEGEEAYNSVSFALKVGYTHIDTAQIYGNEVSVGKAIADSDVAREDIFLTTKLWNDKHDYDLAKASIDESLERLGVDYLDLLLCLLYTSTTGATLQEFLVPTETGDLKNIVLGFDAYEDYYKNNLCACQSIGRVAGRIRCV